MAYEAKKGRLTFSFYVIKRFTQIFVKVNQKMKNKRVLESYYNLFYYQLSSSAGLNLLRSHPSSMKGVLNFVITRMDVFVIFVEVVNKMAQMQDKWRNTDLNVSLYWPEVLALPP